VCFTTATSSRTVAQVTPQLLRMLVRFVVMAKRAAEHAGRVGGVDDAGYPLAVDADLSGRKDKTLTDRLLRELPGILNWSICGWRRLQERGEFLQPESGRNCLTTCRIWQAPSGLRSRLLHRRP